MLDILWHSTAPWSPSSYSVLTSRTLPGIVKAGHKVTLSTWYGLNGAPRNWEIRHKETEELIDTVTILPAVDGDNYGRSVLGVIYDHTKANVLITCSDVFVYDNADVYGTNFCPWLPLDHAPAPPPVLDALRPALYPMVLSQWGQQVLEDAGVKAKYVPAGASAEIFKPGDKKQARKRMGLPDDIDFLAVMVSANKDPLDRKGFNEALIGFANFAKDHPKSALYIHTNANGPMKIGTMAKVLGIEDKVYQAPPFEYTFGMIGEPYMAMVYQAADVLLNTAKSEGFGIPLLEAQLCGTPIAATDYSTTKELLYAGWKIPVVPDWTVGAESFRGRAVIAGVVDALNEAYRERDNKKLSQKARRGALKLDNDRVIDEYWKPALAEIETLLSKSQIAIPAGMAEVTQGSYES